MEATKAKTITRAATPNRSAAATVAASSKAVAAAATTRAPLTVSSPHDAAEREAEAIASRIMRMPAPGAESPYLRRFAGIVPGSQLEARGAKVPRSGEGEVTNTEGVADEIDAAGSGQPLDADVQDLMGSRFEADFTEVRVHSDERAARLNRQLGARAFTLGNQVFFGEGQYAPHSESGRHLIAHELVHTLQSAGPARRQVWCAKKPGAPAKPTLPTKPVGKLATGRLDPAKRTLTFDKLEIPGFKMAEHRGALYRAAALRRPKGATVDREETSQRDKWENDLLPPVRAKVDALAAAHRSGQGSDVVTKLVYEIPAAADGSGSRYFFGGPMAIARRLTRPDWYLKGQLAHDRAYQVDHIVEWQLGGQDQPSNYELLDAATNGDSGVSVKNSIQDRIDDFLQADGKALGYDQDAIKVGFELLFQSAVGTRAPRSISAEKFWTRDQIGSLKHLKGLKVIEPDEIGGSTFVRIFGSAGGGSSRRFGWSVSEEKAGVEQTTTKAESAWLSPWVITHKLFRTTPDKADGDLPPAFGKLRVHLPKGNPLFEPEAPRDISLTRAVAGAPRAGRLRPYAIAEGLQAKYFSPVKLPNLEADAVTGFDGEGVIEPDAVLLKGLHLGIRMRGAEARVFAALDASRFAPNLPKPLRFTVGTVAIFYSNKSGWGAEGRIGLAIDRLGSGSVTASMSSRGGFRLQGDFSFDSTLFDPASVSFVYEQGKWTVDGVIGIPAKIPGVKSGTVRVRFADDKFSVLGRLQVDVPKLARGEMVVSWGEAEGLAIRGDGIQLAVGIPRVREANGRFSLQQRPDRAWRLAAALRAKIAVPGFEALELSGSYDDGLYEIAIDTTIVRGNTTIKANLGFTNRPVGIDGRPMVGPALAAPVFFGSGSATVSLNRWLQGTAAIEVTRDGLVKVEGRLDVPRDFVVIRDDATPTFDRELLPFKGISLHLFGIPGVASLVGTLNGGLRAKADIGAGVIRGAYLAVKYTLGDESSLRVNGGFTFYMPATASIEGYVAVGLRARVLVFVLAGEIKLTVGGGIRADLEIPVNGSWGPQDGFAIDTTIKIVGHPFVFIDVGGSIHFDLDLWLKSWTLYRKPFNLMHKELGANMALGVTVPIKWSQKSGLEFSWDRVSLIFPNEGQAKGELGRFGSDLVGPEVAEADRRN